VPPRTSLPGGVLARLPRPPLSLPGHEFAVPNDNDTLAAAGLGLWDWVWMRDIRGCDCTAADEDDAVTGLGLRHARSPLGDVRDTLCLSVQRSIPESSLLFEADLDTD
jgi:hypothetical protein